MRMGLLFLFDKTRTTGRRGGKRREQEYRAPGLPAGRKGTLLVLNKKSFSGLDLGLPIPLRMNVKYLP